MAHVPFMECGACDEDFPLTPQNTCVVRFKEDPDLDYVLAQCACSMWNRNFVKESTILMLLGRKIPLIEEQYAPGEVREAFCIATDTPLPVFRALTTSEEHQVEYFRWILERGDQS